jgi:hypothetical protein
MLTVRPARETTNVALALIVSTIGVAAATHAWLASGLFGLLFLLRFALQPPDGFRLRPGRRAGLALLGCAALACLVWAVGVRIAQWPG